MLSAFNDHFGGYDRVLLLAPRHRTIAFYDAFMYMLRRSDAVSSGSHAHDVACELANYCTQLSDNGDLETVFDVIDACTANGSRHIYDSLRAEAERQVEQRKAFYEELLRNA